MASKKKASAEQVNEDVAAANQASIAAKPTESKLDQITNTIARMSAMTAADLNKFIEALQMSTQANSTIPDNAAAANQASLSPGGGALREAIADEVRELFDGNEALSEEFKEKAITLFEAALGARFQLLKVQLTEELETKFEDELAEEVAHIEEVADKYCTHIAEEWLAENRLIVESELKVDAADNLFEDLKVVIEKHNIVLPEGKDDVLEQLVTKVESLTEELDNAKSANIELKNQLVEHVKSQMIEEASAELTGSDRVRFEALIEEVTFDPDTFEKKITTIKEQYFTKKETPSETLAKKMVFNEDSNNDTNTVENDAIARREAAPAPSSLGATAGKLFHRR